MKFWEIFRYEFAYQVRRPWPWLNIGVIMFLVFLFMRDGSLSEAMYTEFFINGPFMIAMATVFGNLLWLVTAAFITGESAARDIATGMFPLVYTMPINKKQYLGGRFFAAFSLNLIILFSVQVSILLSIYLPGIHPDSLGPFRPAAFVTAYFFIAVPNAFAATAIQFGFGLKSGRPISAYLGSLLLFFISFFIAGLILFRSGLGTLLDPIGIRFIWDELSHLWTTVEKSHRLLDLKGTLLMNRIVWTTAGLLAISITYITFQFNHRASLKRWWQLLRPGTPTVRTDETTFDLHQAAVHATVPRPPSPGNRNFGFAFNVRRTTEIAWSSFKAIATSWGGLAVLIFIPLLAIPVIIDQIFAISIPLVPTTARVVAELTGPLSADMSRWMVIPGFIIYFVGELVWRERDYRLNELTDTMPGSEWAPALGKFIGISLVLAMFMASLMLSGMIAQLLMDYSNFQIELYFKVLFGLQLPEYILFAALALFIHTTVDQKYVGHLIAIIAYAFIAAIATMLGIEHNLLIFGGGPTWSYSEIREFGESILPWMWFKLYWAAWALLMITVSTLFWSRGKEHSLNDRMNLAKLRFKSATVVVTTIAVLIIVTSGGYIFYNTNILNRYRNSTEVSELRANYEKRYGQYENIAQPKLVATSLNVQIFPERQEVEIRGMYQLLNNTNVSIDSIHVSTSVGGAETIHINFSKMTTLVVGDDELHYRVYALDNPLNPGDSITMNFEVMFKSEGFTNRGVDPAITRLGSYFTNKLWFPYIGYQRQRGIINPAERSEYGLKPRPLLASLAEAHEGEMTSLDEGIKFEAVISTTKGQTAVAPGALHRSWSDNERSYFHYSTSAPIGSEWAFYSTQYEVSQKEWQSSKIAHRPVVVSVYHHAEHTVHVQHMLKSAVSALEYYTEQFGPYPYAHLTIIEHPAGPGTGMHADASMISYGQGYADWLPKNEHALDFPYAVMGHEMGHQWTLPYAYVEGLPFLSEGIAWYYGIMLVKGTLGPEQTRRLMTFMRQPYPHQPIRRGEPLLRAMDPYLSYKRGPLAMYALSEYAGADRVNSAIRKLNEQSDSVGAPLVTTLDLYRELKLVTPDSLQNMLHDFFEVNALWMFETSRVSAEKVRNDKWKITMDVKASKIVYDSAGVETDMPINEWVEIGVFAARKPGEDEQSAPLYLQKHKIQSGEQTIVIEVTGTPVLAGIDPRHLLDWEEKEDDDNIEPVSLNVGEK